MGLANEWISQLDEFRNNHLRILHAGDTEYHDQCGQDYLGGKSKKISRRSNFFLKIGLNFFILFFGPNFF